MNSVWVILQCSKAKQSLQKIKDLKCASTQNSILSLFEHIDTHFQIELLAPDRATWNSKTQGIILALKLD